MVEGLSPYRINPAFHRHRSIAAVVGRILAAFGELEFQVVTLAAEITGLMVTLPKALYRLRVTSARIEGAEVFISDAAAKHGLSDEAIEMFAAVRYCLKIRNQYAHSNWSDDPGHPGLFFTNVEDAEWDVSGLPYDFRHVSLALVRSQEEHFVYAQTWIQYVRGETLVRMGKYRDHGWPKPTRRAQPPAHNPPEKHVPPFLNASQRALHVERALAAKSGLPTSTPKQKALQAARAIKRAKKDADRARDVARKK